MFGGYLGLYDGWNDTCNIVDSMGRLKLVDLHSSKLPQNHDTPHPSSSSYEQMIVSGPNLNFVTDIYQYQPYGTSKHNLNYIWWTASGGQWLKPNPWMKVQHGWR